MGKPEEGSSAMDSAFSGFVLDPAKCSQLNLEEKRELVHEIAQWSNDAPQILRSFTRPELLEIICAEMGKERKYTGFTKSQMIDHLLKLVSEKSKTKRPDDSSPTKTHSPAKNQSGNKRQRKKEHPIQLITDPGYGSPQIREEDQIETVLCKNLACRAVLTPEDAFCKRCSCCICHQFDDNKDPSLWLTCSSDPPYQNNSCGMSCHLECALKHEKTGIIKNGCCPELDGCFYCVCCGKVNDLMGTWRKQLIIAKEARRVDILCYRLSLSHKMLKGTERYKEQQKILDTSVKKLKNELGPLDQVSSRGIVNRLSCGAEVQNLCSSIVESLSGANQNYTNQESSDDTNQERPPNFNIRFEEASPFSVVIILDYEGKLLQNSFSCGVWHRKSTEMDYPNKPSYLVPKPQKRFIISDLDPSTEYYFKLSLFNNTRELGVSEAKYTTLAPNGSSISDLNEDDGSELECLKVQSNIQSDSTNSPENKQVYDDDHSKLRSLDEIKNGECHLRHNTVGVVPLVGSSSVPPSTPSKSDGIHEDPSSGSKKQTSESNYEYCVRVIRWLEQEGHMKKDIRVKFLTWFSLKATTVEKRVVSAFVDTLIDDPLSLADQLMDTFMDKICNEQKPVPRISFCTKLWH